jgi:sarcosine oxidase subunit alpha
MSGPFRLSSGGLIDRTRQLRFRFDGRSLTGFAGDSLASALLANGVRLVGRSFKYHRPRGIYSAGPEEPNALVRLRRGPRAEPNSRATMVELWDGLEAESQNRFPSLAFDLGAVAQLAAPLLPAGFYYKTFKWPPDAWPFYERFIRRAAGLGRAARAPDPDRYERLYLFCDVAVVVDERTQRVIALSVIDNLVKGASGNAVQCFNLMFGLDERAGLWHGGLAP